ncbi:GNAT family N-acetyltransferase [Phycicoccus avicenniae]|uniref:GNAT family N-acetyltransferase n=1 Tax=Phycicoccus avicenniae TaxID=2828860 RepID=UPI003D2E25C8
MVDVDTSSLIVRPLGPDTWPAWEALAARHNGVFGGCWCTWFHTMVSEKPRDADANHALKEQWVLAGRSHAAVVFDGDEAVAWAQYGPPAELPNIRHRKEYEEGLVSPPDYRVTCFFVDRRFRRHGVAEVALRGVVDLVAQSGGGVLEGYPHDLTGSTKKVSSSFLYSTTRSMFERVGFELERTKGEKNTVMRLVVPPA